MKKIAFLITVYKNDSLEFFIQAINSIVEQDFDFEKINIYLGIDGLLPDNIMSYITENKGLFYKTIQNKKNKGLAYTLNRLIENLDEEEFIFRMDSDDICRLDRVTKQVEILNNNQELLLIGSDLIEIDINGRELRYKKMPNNHKDIINYSIARNPFNHPSVALRKSFFTIVGKYDESLIKSQDYELWARALTKNIEYTNINEPLIYFRIASDYMKKRNSLVNYTNELKISLSLMWHFKKFNQLPKILIKFLIRILPSSIGEYAYKKIRK